MYEYYSFYSMICYSICVYFWYMSSYVTTNRSGSESSYICLTCNLSEQSMLAFKNIVIFWNSIVSPFIVFYYTQDFQIREIHLVSHQIISDSRKDDFHSHPQCNSLSYIILYIFINLLFFKIWISKKGHPSSYNIIKITMTIV